VHVKRFEYHVDRYTKYQTVQRLGYVCMVQCKSARIPKKFVHPKAHKPTQNNTSSPKREAYTIQQLGEEVRLTTPKHNNEASSKFSHRKRPRRPCRWEWYDEGEREQEHRKHTAVNLVGKAR
jgi:hypothetical protein